MFFATSKRATVFVQCLLLAAMSAAPIAHADNPFVLRSNFDAVLRIDDGFEEVKSRVDVRAGSTFPIEFQNHKLTLAVLPESDDKFTIELRILEKSQTRWFPLNPKILKIGGSFGIPLEYKWSEAEVEVDLAIVVSRARL